MKKIKKKLLVISDDYESYITRAKQRLSQANYFYAKESNWLSFDVTLVNCFFKLFDRSGKQIAPIDADIIVIDFSLISYGKWEKRCVEKLARRCDILFLTSMVSEYVSQEREEMKYYNQFPVVDARIEDMIHGIYFNCEKAGLKERWSK